MANIHHKPIKRFGIDGSIADDSMVPRLRGEYSKLLETEMRIKGYVPRLDIEQDFTIQYNYKTQHYYFELSLYGVYVGKKKSEWIQGADATKLIYMENSKSKEFLSEAA